MIFAQYLNISYFWFEPLPSFLPLRMTRRFCSVFHVHNSLFFLVDFALMLIPSNLHENTFNCVVAYFIRMIRDLTVRICYRLVVSYVMLIFLEICSILMDMVFIASFSRHILISFGIWRFSETFYMNSIYKVLNLEVRFHLVQCVRDTPVLLSLDCFSLNFWGEDSSLFTLHTLGLMSSSFRLLCSLAFFKCPGTTYA